MPAKRKYPPLPSGMVIREEPKLQEGDKWYGDPALFWFFRAIHHTAGLDYVPDRGGFKTDQMTDERVSFVKSVLGSGRFAEWVRVQSGSSREVFCADHGGLHLRASNNGSYGYTYLWAWEAL